MTDIQNKFDKLASDNGMLKSKIIMAEKTTRTLQENLNSINSKTTELERSIHKLQQHSRRESVEIPGIPRDFPHVILEEVVIKLQNKINVNLIKNDLMACHRLAISDRTIIKVLNRKNAEQIHEQQKQTKKYELFRYFEQNRSLEYFR